MDICFNQLNYFFSYFSSGNLEGKHEKRNYRALVEDPQLQFSGFYQRFVNMDFGNTVKMYAMLVQ